jgi:hypothetical protein
MSAEILARLRALFHGRLCYLKDTREDADENVLVFILNAKVGCGVRGQGAGVRG